MNSKMRTLAVLFLISCAALVGAIGWMKPVRSYIIQSTEAPEVIVAHKSQAPLEIVSTKLDAVTTEKPEIEFNDWRDTWPQVM